MPSIYAKSLRKCGIPVIWQAREPFRSCCFPREFTTIENWIEFELQGLTRFSLQSLKYQRFWEGIKKGIPSFLIKSPLW